MFVTNPSYCDTTINILPLYSCNARFSSSFCTTSAVRWFVEHEYVDFIHQFTEAYLACSPHLILCTWLRCAYLLSRNGASAARTWQVIMSVYPRFLLGSCLLRLFEISKGQYIPYQQLLLFNGFLLIPLLFWVVSFSRDTIRPDTARFTCPVNGRSSNHQVFGLKM